MAPGGACEPYRREVKWDPAQKLLAELEPLPRRSGGTDNLL